MASPKKSKALMKWILLIGFAIGCESVIRQRVYKSSSPTECVTEQIGESWTSASRTTCSGECWARYQDQCQSSVYNAQTKTCRAGAVAFRPLSHVKISIPKSTSDESIVFTKQPIPSCPGPDYSLYEMCGLTLCLHLSTKKVPYTTARANCDQIGGRMFVGNTMARFVMFMHLSKDTFKFKTWIGLNDLVKDKSFVWENGEPLSDKQDYIWTSWEPNNSNKKEHCVEAPHQSWNKGLADVQCRWSRFYVCEPYGS